MIDTKTLGDEQTAVSELEAARLRLRERWELASVLNFLKVFEPVIKSNLKISAEEIETALIEANNSLAQLHIMILKGIPPVSKTLNNSDAWVVALSKKLIMWWPWVAEGDFPLTAAKGSEMARYKELDPTIRLMILKALCEIRADQDDTISYINDTIKNGTELSTFRKDKIGGDGKGTSYWCDGNATIGLRLYKEVNKYKRKPKYGEDGAVPTISSQWKTLATNLEEFNRVVDEFSSSESRLEVAVSETVKTEAIPVLNKLHKKKERALQQKQRQERLLNGFRSSGITRSCRTLRHISYTFDDYDKAIDEAIRQTKKSKTKEDQKHVRNEPASNEYSGKDTQAGEEGESTETDKENKNVDDVSETSEDGESTETDKEDKNLDDVSETSSEEYGSEHSDDVNDMENKSISNRDRSTLNSDKQTSTLAHKTKGSRRSERVAGNIGHAVPQIRNLGAKNISRQRPNHNTALESATVPDSEDEISFEDSDR